MADRPILDKLARAFGYYRMPPRRPVAARMADARVELAVELTNAKIDSSDVGEPFRGPYTCHVGFWDGILVNVIDANDQCVATIRDIEGAAMLCHRLNLSDKAGATEKGAAS